MNTKQVELATELLETETWAERTTGMVGLRYAPRPAKRVFYIDTSDKRMLSGDGERQRFDVLDIDTVIDSGWTELVDAHPNAGRTLARFGPTVPIETVQAMKDVLCGLWGEAHALGYEDGFDEGWESGWRQGRKSVDTNPA